MDLKDLEYFSKERENFKTQKDLVSSTAAHAAIQLGGFNRIARLAEKERYRFNKIARAAEQFRNTTEVLAQERNRLNSLASATEQVRNRLDIVEATAQTHNLRNFRALSVAETWLKNEAVNRERINSIVNAKAMAQSKTSAWIAAEEKRRRELFSSSFHSIRNLSIALKPAISNVPNHVANYPINEVHRHITLVDVFTAEPDLCLEDQPETDSDENLLRSNYPDLARMLDGAKQAIETTNPDKQRHVITSIRELLTHILHRLAPDKDIFPWIPQGTEDQFLCRKRPTRICRLSYICRNINSKPLNKFVDTDIDAMVEFISLLQGGTHSAKDRFTEQQLKALVARAEGIVVFLLSIELQN